MSEIALQITMPALAQQLAKYVSPDFLAAQRVSLNGIISDLLVAMGEGHSCLQLDNPSARELVLASQLVQLYVGSSGLDCLENKPFVLYITPQGTGLLYLTRYFYYEQQIAHKVSQLSQPKAFSSEQIERREQLERQLTQAMQQHQFPNDDQFAAINASLVRKFSIITGGPGTGKTTSVVVLLWAFYQLYGADLRVKICAPTGKAAKRVKESLQANISQVANILQLDVSHLQALVDNPSSFGTIHNLLGYVHNSIYFRQNERNPLDCDILIVDESSMVGLPLFHKLLLAISSSRIKHLVLLGDPNQLSSVEEGFVFSSLVAAGQPLGLVSQLKISKRNEGAVGLLASAILTNNYVQAGELLTTARELSLRPPRLRQLLDDLLNGAESYLNEFINLCQEVNDIRAYPRLFASFSQNCLLCMTNRGNLGVDNLNLQLEQIIKRRWGFSETWYSGRSIIILENDHTLNLYNGDIGICLLQHGQARVVFDDGRSFIPELLPRYQLAFAISIHKSQGSEYQQVTVVLPEFAASLLSRELVYTAVTRAKTGVTLYAQGSTLEPALASNTQRVSGLVELLINVAKSY